MASEPFPRLSLEQHLFGPGPKRILALDGGGLLGIIEIAFLEQIEQVLRAQHGGDPDFRLCDYFDLIGGTSTGAIIATALALGWPVAKIRTFYESMAGKIFDKKTTNRGFAKPVYKATALAKILWQHLEDERFESAVLKTGLVVTAKRLDTGSPWVMINSKDWIFWNDKVKVDPTTGHSERTVGNRFFHLREILRASAAAPFYLPPQDITIHEKYRIGHNGVAEPYQGVFADGGVTPYGNPSLILLMMARMRVYGLDWRLGRDELLMVSLGTGSRRILLSDPRSGLESYMPVQLLRSYRSVLGMMRDSTLETVKIMQSLSDPKQPWRINSEVERQVGDFLLPGDFARSGQELLSFQRYDLELKREHDDFVNPAIVGPVYLEAAKAAAPDSPLGVKSEHFPAAFHLARVRDAAPPSIAQRVKDMRSAKRPSVEPPLTIGVVGHRPNRLPAGELPRIKSQIAAALEELRGSRGVADVVVMSGLAEGTDRIVSEMALGQGMQISALLPFKRQDYAQDFSGPGAAPEALADFDRLLAVAIACTEVLTPEAAQDRNAGYAGQGAALVHAAQALIAVWDGQAAHGRGGTEEVVAAAVAKGIPVLWISIEPGAPLRRL